MTVQFENYEYKYQTNKGKWVFVPSDKGRKIGDQLKKFVDRLFKPKEYYFHLHNGGHVSALHLHRAQKYYCKVDLQNFFNSVSRNRVKRALRDIGFPNDAAEQLAKWSCVKNPLEIPAYALPYGFVQSPILATLVLDKSPIGQFFRNVERDIGISIYMDDIGLSSNNYQVLEIYYHKIRDAIIEAEFRINEKKSHSPTEYLSMFNCDMATGQTSVTQSRREQFYSVTRTDHGHRSFEQYCYRVELENTI